MLWRLRDRAVPILFLVLSSLWTAGIYCPLFYSLAFPSHEIQRLVEALKGHEPARQELSSLVQNVVDSSGRLRRAIRVSAYYGATAEYKANQSHTSTKTESAYIAWFEKRPKPTILIVSVSEIDSSGLQFNIQEGDAMALARTLLFPLFALAFSVYWFCRRRISGFKKPIAQENPPSS